MYFDVRVQLRKSSFSCLRLLREEIVGEADSELALFGQLLDDGVVVGIVLEAAAGIDGACDAEPVQLPHEMACRVDLVVERQFRPLGQRRIEDAGVGLGEQQAGRIAIGIADDLAARRVRRVLGVADGTERRAVEHGAVVEMQQEHRRVWCNGIQLVDGRQSLLGELMLGEATDDAHPLRRRRDGDLPLQHAHGVGQ